MPAKVVDASAVAAVIFREPAQEEVVEQLRGAALCAPVLLGFELASVCLKKLASYPKQRAAILDAFDLVGKLDIKQLLVDHRQSMLLAEETGITAYDAAYLWLARELKADLVTLDVKLARAAERALRR